MTNVIKQIVKGEGDSQTIKMIVRDNERGPQGEQGEPGQSATISVGQTNTLPAGSAATVTNSGSSSTAVLNFGIPKGDKGDAGAAATVTVGATTTLPTGYNAIVQNSGTSSAAILDFSIPQGAQGPRGYKGDKGDKGDKGEKGVDGAIHYTAGTGINITSNNVIEATGASTAAWGGIQGTLSDQTDLQNALDGLQGSIDAVDEVAETALQPEDINYTVMADVDVNSNASTNIVQLDAAKVNLETGATSTKNIPLPVASTTQAGVMNSATFDAVSNNTSNLNSLLNGSVAISSLPASPTQASLTTAWQSETGLATIINRAQILDVTNSKIWTYYTNTSTWYEAPAGGQITINTFTNSSEGTIKGSTNTGQVFAENDGTGSVNGWDALNTAVSDNTANKLASANLSVSDGLSKTTTGSGANTAIDIGINNAGIGAGKINFGTFGVQCVANSASGADVQVSFTPRTSGGRIEVEAITGPTWGYGGGNAYLDIVPTGAALGQRLAYMPGHIYQGDTVGRQMIAKALYTGVVANSTYTFVTSTNGSLGNAPDRIIIVRYFPGF